MMLNNEKDLTAWLETAYSREATGSYDDCKLEPITCVLAQAGLDQLRPITVAGTKGKGSAVTFLESILKAHGQSTLVFSSPHVSSIYERWRYNGAEAHPTIVADAAAKLAELEQQTAVTLTYFERCFAIAALMANSSPDCLFLCEVGLGGRLDCANALDARIAILTHISYDHCHVLGDTLEEIATEKLAIARPTNPLLIAKQLPNAEQAIQQVLPVQPVATWTEPSPTNLPLGLAGEHQRSNAGVALAASQLVLKEQWNQETAYAALAKTTLPGRCQLIKQGDRTLIIDGAHNGASIRATLAYADRTLHPGYALILGVAKDKDIERIAAVIADERTPIILCAYDHPRSRIKEDWPAPLAARADYAASLPEALSRVSPGQDLCITGSLYLAGEALKLFHAK